MNDKNDSCVVCGNCDKRKMTTIKRIHPVFDDLWAYVCEEHKREALQNGFFKE